MTAVTFSGKSNLTLIKMNPAYVACNPYAQVWDTLYDHFADTIGEDSFKNVQLNPLQSVVDEFGFADRGYSWTGVVEVYSSPSRQSVSSVAIRGYFNALTGNVMLIEG
ncbi:hypothetical protein CH252_05015 [Rhodococcus sp. 06-1477-1B]|nr:hypothetical protein CH252_05015 [Rhodococcus sp. 06-1477-1B]